MARWPDGHKWPNMAKMAIYGHMASEQHATNIVVEFCEFGKKLYCTKYLKFIQIWARSRPLVCRGAKCIEPGVNNCLSLLVANLHTVGDLIPLGSSAQGQSVWSEVYGTKCLCM